MRFYPNVLKGLEVQPEFSVISDPDLLFKVRGGTVENAAYLDFRRAADGVKKILFELDVATGKATLRAE